MYSITLKVRGKLIERRFARTEIGSYWDAIVLAWKAAGMAGPGRTMTHSEDFYRICYWVNGACVTEIILDDDVPTERSDNTSFDLKGIYA